MNAISLPDVFGGSQDLKVIFDMEPNETTTFKWPDMVYMVRDSSFICHAMGLAIDFLNLLFVCPFSGCVNFQRAARGVIVPHLRAATWGSRPRPIVFELPRVIFPIPLAGCFVVALLVFFGPLSAPGIKDIPVCLAVGTANSDAIIAVPCSACSAIGIGPIPVCSFPLTTSRFGAIFTPNSDAVLASRPLEEIGPILKSKAFRASFPVHRSILS